MGREVLLVPHCSECNATMGMLLSLGGWRVESVRGAEEAVRRGLELRLGAALIDLELPGGGSGLEVGRQLRAGLGRGARLIGLAGASWDGDEGAWAAAGFDGWLRKPASPEDLIRLLARAPSAGEFG